MSKNHTTKRNILACKLSGKRYQKVKDRSHSMQATIRMRKVNLIRMRDENTGKMIKVSVRSLKTLKKKSLSLKSALKISS
jgi:ribosomal protein L28